MFVSEREAKSVLSFAYDHDDKMKFSRTMCMMWRSAGTGQEMSHKGFADGGTSERGPPCLNVRPRTAFEGEEEWFAELYVRHVPRLNACATRHAFGPVPWMRAMWLRTKKGFSVCIDAPLLLWRVVSRDFPLKTP
jgi:hypothetical protein